MKSYKSATIVSLLALCAIACEPEYSGLDFEIVNEPGAIDAKVSDELLQLYAGTAVVVKVTPRGESQHDEVTLIAEDEDILRVETGRDDTEYVFIGNAPGITGVIVWINQEEVDIIDAIVLPWGE